MSQKQTWNNVETWQVQKPAVSSKHGLVASQHYAASATGAQVLSQGGNAIDAAIAASLMIGTVEPWMSGLGGGGNLLYFDAATNTTHSVGFGMRAPDGVSADDYPLVAGEDSDLFGWPSVLENRNVSGPLSIAIPGYLAGISAALDRFGSKSFSELVTPAIESARNGMSADWYATLKIASAAPVLNQFEESRATYLPDGFAPAGEWGGPLPRIVLGNLAHTLEALRDHGPEDFYHGKIATMLCDDAKHSGAKICRADLKNYEPVFGTADEHEYSDSTIYASPGMTAGPTLRDALSRLQSRLHKEQKNKLPDSATFSAYADSLHEAYVHRLQTMGDVDDSGSPACTTHLSVVDSNGNMVSLTQTLLSVFGSKVMFPQTGILMNNGMMWFDPRPGKPNSIAPGKHPLSNMCPTLFRTANGTRYALGASGGRRIMPSVMQLISFITDYHMSIDEALHHGRIDVSGAPMVCVDEALDSSVMDALADNHNVMRVPNAVYPALFACPNIVSHNSEGMNTGASYVMSPWAAVIAEEATT